MGNSIVTNSRATPALDQFEEDPKERPTRQSLKPVRDYLEDLPELPFKVVQVVGSNGKGTTLHAAEQALVEHGRSTVSCSSPHLISPTERLKVNAESVSERTLDRRLSELQVPSSQAGFTPFERIFLAAVHEALEREVDYLLLEAGMGGRWDATSALGADWTICTGVELEHTEYLGDDKKKILTEMTAQIPPGSNLVTVELEDDLDEVVMDLAQEKNLDLFVVEAQREVFELQKSLVARFLTGAEDLSGSRATRLLAEVNRPRGRGTIRREAERVFFYDVAHTPAAVKNSFRLQPELKTGEWFVVYGSLAGKRTAEILNVIENNCRVENLFLTAPPSPRAVEASELNRRLPPDKAEVLPLDRVEQRFIERSNPGDGLAILGSFPLVGWFMKQ